LRDSLGDIWRDHLPLLSCLQTEERPSSAVVFLIDLG
jgi:hypothetical protein